MPMSRYVTSNVFHRPQLEPLETLRKRGKLNCNQVSRVVQSSRCVRVALLGASRRRLNSVKYPVGFVSTNFSSHFVISSEPHQKDKSLAWFFVPFILKGRYHPFFVVLKKQDQKVRKGRSCPFRFLV